MIDRWKRARTAAIAVGLLVPMVLVSPARAAAARAWDFDGDGRRDLAIGVAGENDGAGSLIAVRGTPTGLASSAIRRFSQATPGIPGVPEAADFFGSTLASGDFDGDGFADLAVGAPGEDVGSVPDVGSVAVLYGGPRGLSREDAHRVPIPEAVLGDTDHEAARFGYRLAAGDFDDDGDADLVVATGTGLGALLVYRGRTAGLSTTPAQQIGPENGLSQLETLYADDLAVGDLNGDGIPDLALGAMNHDQARGAVVVLYGASGVGLNLRGDDAPRPQLWTEDSEGVKGVAAELDAFGSSVGIGDVTGDGRKDLVVGVVQQPTADPEATGAIHVLRGTRSGVSATGDQYLTYDQLAADPVGALGVELAVGDLNGDGVADVAVARGDKPDHRWGAILVMLGDRDGLGLGTNRTFTQATEGIAGAREAVDYWGDGLAIRDVGWSEHPDLIVADSLEDVGGMAEAGLVNVLWGSSGGVSADRSRAVTEASTGVPGEPQQDDRFGQGI